MKSGQGVSLCEPPASEDARNEEQQQGDDRLHREGFLPRPRPRRSQASRWAQGISPPTTFLCQVCCRSEADRSAELVPTLVDKVLIEHMAGRDG